MAARQSSGRKQKVFKFFAFWSKLEQDQSKKQNKGEISLIHPHHAPVLHHALSHLFETCLTKECMISPPKEKRTPSEAAIGGVL